MKRFFNITILDSTILEWIYTIIGALLALPIVWFCACVILSMGD